MAQITYVKSRTARIFWENGFKTVAAVAGASVNDILPILLLVNLDRFSDESGMLIVSRPNLKSRNSKGRKIRRIISIS